MRYLFVPVLAIACLLTLHGDASAQPRTITSFHTMYGVDGPFVGTDNAIRGIPGDDLPWEVRFVNGSLTTNGHLRIVVHGLVFKDEDPVPEDKRGINDEANFRGVVSCLTESGDRTPTANVATAGFPASVSGNSIIDATVELPNPCVAPVIFVTGEDPDKWFAVSGFEKEED